MAVGSVLSFRTDCVTMEAGIKAQYSQNENNYDNMWKKFREMAQIPEMYTNDLKKVYDAAIQGRYGADGAKAAVQFIQEHNPPFDSAMYTKLQAAIEAGRNGFEADQKQLIDKKRQYEVVLNSNRAIYANVLLNFPRIDMDKYNIVTSEQTQQAFQEKRAAEIRLR
jgi:uncharacterized membrane-anchored protein